MVDRPPLHKQGYTRGGVAVLPLPVPGVARYDRPGPAGLPPSPRVDPACQLVNMLCQRRGLDGRFLSVGLMGSYELGCWACGPPPVSTPRVNLSTYCVNVGASMGGSYQLA